MVVFPDVQVLDVVGPLEVFSLANRALVAGRGVSAPYRLETVAEHRGPVSTTGPSVLVAKRALGRPRRDIDTLLVAGGEGVARAARREPVLAWLRATTPHCRRWGSVCSGAFLLAEAGLLAGKRAATHWSRCEELGRRYPTVRVDGDALYVRDGACVTSAGITAGIDLALALVEEDWGRALALSVARQLVVFLYRSGGQSQFSQQLASQAAEREGVRALQTYIAEHPGASLDVATLARRAALSPRQFARVFKAELGKTPGRYVEAARLETARALLERTAHTVEEIAARAGFGTAESMRRRFVARLGVSPRTYRERFAKPGGLAERSPSPRKAAPT